MSGTPTRLVTVEIRARFRDLAAEGAMLDAIRSLVEGYAEADGHVELVRDPVFGGPVKFTTRDG